MAALEFFDGEQWRPISLDEAKYRHAEGQGDRLREIKPSTTDGDEEESPPTDPATVDKKPVTAPAASPPPSPSKPARERQR